MKKILVLSMLMALLLVGIGSAMAADSGNSPGPATNSGDGIPDGSGLDTPNGPNGSDTGKSPGPAPNSGDGIPDGPGWDDLEDWE
ncbi:hypothetical protein ACFL2G_00270 [Candidatus Omnitrophota bacterium]